MIISILSLTFYVYMGFFPLEIPTSGKIPNSSLVKLASIPFLVTLSCFGSLVICHW